MKVLNVGSSWLRLKIPCKTSATQNEGKRHMDIVASQILGKLWTEIPDGISDVFDMDIVQFRHPSCNVNFFSDFLEQFTI